MGYPLPSDTRRALDAAAGRPGSPGLVFDRYPRFDREWELDGASRKAILDRVCEATRDPAYTALLRANHRRWEAGAEARGVPPDCRFTARAESRIVIGLGRGGTTDTGFTFHRLFGFPYVPGSALKGLTQAFALFEAAEQFGVPGLTTSEGHEAGVSRPRGAAGPPSDPPIRQLEAALLERESKACRARIDRMRNDERIPAAARLKRSESIDAAGEMMAFGQRYRAVFGDPSEVGGVVFFDAVPVESPGLVVDIMNPHYADYYGGREPPTGYLNPIPVYFLAVQAGARFAFAIGLSRTALGASEREQRGVTAARDASRWLRAALTTLGTGAKTGAGYGYWALDSG